MEGKNTLKPPSFDVRMLEIYKMKESPKAFDVEAAIGFARKIIIDQQVELGHDEDWVPTLILMSKSDCAVIPLIPVMESKELRDLFLTTFYPQVVQDLGITTVGLITMAWQVKEQAAEGDDIETTKKKMLNRKRVQPSKDPNRQEILMISAYDSRGGHKTEIAIVHRHPKKPPTLDEFNEMGEVGGNLAEMLINGLMMGRMKTLGITQPWVGRIQ